MSSLRFFLPFRQGDTKISIRNSEAINSNRINSIKVDAPGYYAAYVLSKEGPGVVCSLDANGAHGFNMSKERMSIDNFVIPQDIDIIQFAKCTGNGVGNDTGDGTVQRFDHSDRRVKVGTKPYPDKPTAQTIEYDRRAAQIINEAADGTLFLDYIGEVSSSIEDGCTHVVDNHSYFHGGVIVSNNAYEKSWFYTPNVNNNLSDLQTIVEEMVNSSTGIRWDAGGARSPYIGFGAVIIPEGKRAIRLVNKMPLGFKFSTTSVPAVDLSCQEPIGAMSQELGPDQNPHDNHMLRMPGERMPGDYDSRPGHGGAREWP